MASLYDGHGNKITVEGTGAQMGYDNIMRSVAHRGYGAPENTLHAVRTARKTGFTYVEIDVQFTADGVPVLLHDNTIDRTSDGSGNIADLTYEQLLVYDFGSWAGEAYAGTKIPTFEEFIALSRKIGVNPYVEIKYGDHVTEAYVRSLVDIVNRYGMMERTTWIAFSYGYLEWVKSYAPGARLGYLVQQELESVVNQAVALKTDHNTVFLDANIYTDQFIGWCIAQDVPLEVWTIDNAEMILALPGYVTGVTSNHHIAGEVIYNANIQ